MSGATWCNTARPVVWTRNRNRTARKKLGLSYPSLKDWKRRYYGDATPPEGRSGQGSDDWSLLAEQGFEGSHGLEG